jgi:hypothetical protein
MRLLHGRVERAGRRDDRLDRRAHEPSAAQRSCSLASRDGGERLIIPLTARLQDALANIDDDTVDEVAAQWAAPDEYYGTGAGTELAAGALRDLVRLVRAGRERAEALYCWVCV